MQNDLMKEYDNALRNALENGEDRPDRTGVGTRSVFGERMVFDLEQGFPAITTKKLAWKAVVSELLWFLEGSTSERRLAQILYGTSEVDGKKTIWTANQSDFAKRSYEALTGDEVGWVGQAYGHQFRNFGIECTHDSKEPYGHRGVDQIENLLDGLKKDPHGRRHLVSLWNPGQTSPTQVALPPCHVLSQFYVSKGNKLNCQYYMRSNDLFLGAPFNIASYALLTHMIAFALDMEVGKLIHINGDSHIYSNHIEQVKLQLSREHYPAPKLKIDCNKEELNYFLKYGGEVESPKLSCFTLEGYQSHPTIAAEMAV